jgi:DNA-binding NarL/FixJ family response regulator
MRTFDQETIPRGSKPIVLVEERALMRDYITRGFGASCKDTFIGVSNLDNLFETCEQTDCATVLLCRSGLCDKEETIDLLHDVKEHLPHMPVIVLSDTEDGQEIIEVLQAGAQGYIPTSLPLDIAVEAIRLVNAGGTFIPANSLSSARIPQERNYMNRNTPYNGMFTDRQVAVIEGLRRGKQNKIIAYELNVSESTVKVHVRNIMKKLNARNRTEVAFIINKLHEA